MDSQRFSIKYAAVRRDIIEREFEKLNPAQREAVFATEGPLLILAGAGSGKTTVLINRIANLIHFGRGYESKDAPDGAGQAELGELVDYLQNPADTIPDRIRALCAVDPAPPWSILAITFTNKAAHELKDRLERMLGTAALDVWASTFHSACVRILRRDAERLGFSRSFTIYDDDDHMNVLRTVIREKNLDEKTFVPRVVAGVIGRAKDKLQGPGEFSRENLGDYRMSRIAEVYDAYQQRLRSANALDFDDLIVYTVKLLQDCPEVLEYYRRKFRYVLVDEYQDTNYAQYRLTSLLAGGRDNLCVVGDDDQSIYRFRGATIENILNFEKNYPNARVIRLEQNYRSTQMILNAANGVIANNEGRKGKKLWTQNPVGEKIAFYSAYNEQEEAQYIAAHILAGYQTGLTPRDFAILYRINVQSNTVENALKRNGIPYRIVGGLRFFDRAEVRDMLAYLWVIANHDDALRMRRIVNVPARKIGEKRVEEALRIAAEQNLTLYEVFRRAESFGAFDRAAAPMESFAAMLEELRALSETAPLDEFYDAVLEKTGYAEALTRKGDPDSLGRLENVRELRTNIVEYMKSHDDPTLDGFLEETALFTDIDRYDEGADAVVLMTVHSAKGLEFPVVFLCGMEEGIFPSYRSTEEEGQLEEERRLCYVGITRARKKLHITCAKSRMIFGKANVNHVSRFVEEIPPECIDRPAPGEAKVHSAEGRRKGISAFGKNAARPHKNEVGTPAAGVTGMAGVPGITVASRTPPLFRVGEVIEHTAFGRGTVAQLNPMGGDMLLTIEFDKMGTKRLMANTASRFIRKPDKKRDGAG